MRKFTKKEIEKYADKKFTKKEAEQIADKIYEMDIPKMIRDAQEDHNKKILQSKNTQK
jgi:hypothetical protein